MKTMRCLECYWYKWSFLTGEHTETRPCGFLPINEPKQLTLF